MRKRCIVFCVLILIYAISIEAQNQLSPGDTEVDYPSVPRVSAYEAYVKYKAGKAIILHGGGEVYRRRHIMGALNYDLKEREKLILKLPQKGIEIFTYCYWATEAGGAGLAHEMIEMGFNNVRHVLGGGGAMEKHFDHYKDGKIISPTTGRVIRVKP